MYRSRICGGSPPFAFDASFVLSHSISSDVSRSWSESFSCFLSCVTTISRTRSAATSASCSALGWSNAGARPDFQQAWSLQSRSGPCSSGASSLPAT